MRGFVKDNGTIEGEGWWIFALSALINGNAADLVEQRKYNHYLLPSPEDDYLLSTKKGLSGLISGLRQLTMAGLTTHRHVRDGEHEHSIDHLLLGPISYRWWAANEGPSFSLSARGRPILTCQPVTRESAMIRWHFDDPLRREVEEILNCPTGYVIHPEKVADGGIAISRPEEYSGWFPLLFHLWKGNADEIISARNKNTFLLPEQRQHYKLPRRAGHRGFVDIFRHIERLRHTRETPLPKHVREHCCTHPQLGELCWRYSLNPAAKFELDIKGETILRSADLDNGSWQVEWPGNHQRRALVEYILNCPSGQEHHSEAWID